MWGHVRPEAEVENPVLIIVPVTDMASLTSLLSLRISCLYLRKLDLWVDHHTRSEFTEFCDSELQFHGLPLTLITEPSPQVPSVVLTGGFCPLWQKRMMHL